MSLFKKFVLLQILLTLAAVVLGSMLNNGVAYNLSQYHGAVGRVVGIVGLVTVILSWVKKQTSMAKALSFISLVLLIVAGFAGRMFAQQGNQLFFSIMGVSGLLALTSSILLFF